MAIILGNIFDLLYNNGMLSVLISTHNIQLRHKIRKFPMYIYIH